jgi:DnaK suppressor protein
MKKKNSSEPKEDRVISRLKSQEDRVKRAIEADANNIKELQSEWQETDSPSERNTRAVEWNQYSALHKELTEIEDAKMRINEGIYGICEKCEETISIKRLESIPTARLCIMCQSEEEKEAGVFDRTPSL